MIAAPLHYSIFIAAPDNVDELCAKAAAWDRDYEMTYRDNGIEFTFGDRAAAIKFLLFTRSIQS
jgi:hypothetical protein